MAPLTEPNWIAGAVTLVLVAVLAVVGEWLYGTGPGDDTEDGK